MTVAAHLVTTTGQFGLRLPSPLAWRLTWIPAVVILLGYYTGLWLFFTTERLVGEAAGVPGHLLPALAFNLSPAVVTAGALGILWLLMIRKPVPRRFALMTALGILTSVVTLLIGGYVDFLPVSVLYVSAGFPLLLGCVGGLCTLFGATAEGERRTAMALLLILAAALAPSTVSELMDGSRFDYRPALAHIEANDPRGTVVMWPKVQAMWAAPELDSIELRGTTPVSVFDSLSTARDRFWVIASQRRMGMVGDNGGAKQQWLARHCDRVLTTRKPRFDYEQYVTMLWDCRH
jgi:hypothetical protein